MRDHFDISQKFNAACRPVMATIITADMQASLRAYTDALDYQLIKDGTLCEALALHFGLPALTENRMAVLGPKSGVPVFMRLIEDEQAEPATNMEPGWFALELCVQNVDLLYEQLNTGSHFAPFAQPKPLSFTDKVYPMQCVGPSGEILYLNEVRGDVMGLDMPIASCFVDHLFIAITSAPDMEKAICFYQELLGMDVKERHEISYKTINRVHGLPLETPHKLATLGGKGFVALEVDQSPRRDEDKKHLPSDKPRQGIYMVSFSVDKIDTKNIFGPVKSFPKAPYSGASSAICLGPAREPIELICFD